MEINKKPLGKVSLTCAGVWDAGREYERITIVNDGNFASYISKKHVPKGIILSNEEYWQPIANLREDIKIDYEEFKKEYLQIISDIQLKLREARIVVNTEQEREELTFNEVAPGCEVYVKETKLTYILDTIIPIVSVKTWHLQISSKVDSKEKFELEGVCEELTAGRAIADREGRVIDEEYLTRYTIKNYVDSVVIENLKKMQVDIPTGSLTQDMLSQSLLDLISSGGQVINNADEEDLTSKVLSNGSQVLKFKDKQYREGTSNGMGKVYLRKNMAGQINLLEQSMINKPNTIYIIQYDYCLNDAEIVIPENCVLQFEGGTLNNGTINLNNTKLNNIIGDITDYITTTITGIYAKGQMLYDSTMKKMKLWNGDDWTNLDGTPITQ